MAHDEDTKARTLALLMLGNTPRYVAEQTGVPLTTVRRWRPAALALWDEMPGIDELRRATCVLFPGFRSQNGPKKSKRDDRVNRGMCKGVL